MLRLSCVGAIAMLGCAATPKMTTTNWPALNQPLLEQAATTYNFRLGHPIPVAITKDGGVLFRRTPAREFASDLFELRTDGTIATLFQASTTDENLSDAEKARRERTRTATKGVVDVDVSTDGTRVMFCLGSTCHVLDRPSGTTLAAVDLAPLYDPHLSPDGRSIAFVRDGDLYVHQLAGAKTTRLTTHPEGIEYGVADFAAQEELGRTRGYWWSPDSTQLAFETVDTRAMDTIYVSDPRNPTKPPVPFKYPRAGRPNATVGLATVAITGGKPVVATWDPRFAYLVAVDWHAKGGLTALVIDRDQETAQYLAIRGTTSTLLVEDHDDAWLDFAGGRPKWRPDGTGFLWMTEQHGDAWTLELRAPDGTVTRRLTPPELGLRRLVDADERGAIVLASTDPIHQHVYRIPYDGGSPVRLSANDGESTALASSASSTIAITTLLAAGGRRVHVVRSDGTRVELPSVAEQPSLVPTTELTTVSVGGRTHHVAITRPRSFVPGRRYPVLLEVYAGPHKAFVTSPRDGYVMDQFYADAGFIIVRSDGRGTPHRGRAWERAILRDLITIPLADQVDALKAVGARYRELDLDRVGIFGWSFGGYVATLAALLRPDVFKAAIAGAPVTDWQLYDTAYTERYMKQPTANADGYTATSALAHADKLTRPLLVIHGITDDNVHFAHTLSLIEALYLAGKRAEIITLSATHMVPDPKLFLARERVQIEFFRDHL